MNWVCSKQALTKHSLARQLSEIEAEKKAAQARHQKTLDTLGNDLDRIQRSTRDMNLYYPTDSPRKPPRRLSMPTKLSETNSSSFRSRKLSVPTFTLRSDATGSSKPRSISSLKSVLTEKKPLVSKDLDNSKTISSQKSEDTTYSTLPKKVTGQSQQQNNSVMAAISPSRRSSLPKTNTAGPPHIDSHQTENKNHKNATTSRRAAKVTPRPNQLTKERSPETTNHHTTQVVVHEDDDDEREQTIFPDKAVSSTTSDTECSMFESHRHKTRRASEPQIGSHFLRQLQQRAQEEHDDQQSHSRLGPEHDAMKKTIESQLPSHIVAEQEGDEECRDEVDESSKKSAKARNCSTPSAMPASTPTNTARVPKHTKPAKSTEQKDVQKLEELDRIEDEKLKSRMKTLKQRRKSEADCLKFSAAWGLRHTLEKTSVKKPSANPATSKADDALKREAESNGIWDAVRKCRYIRGYDPPDMRQPEDLGEFVFGHSMRPSDPEP